MKTAAFALLILVQCHLLLTLYVPQRYVVPNPTLTVFSPRGFTVSIPDESGIELFAFHGNINRPMMGLEAGQFSRDVLKKRGDKWVFEDKSAELKEGDVIYYWLFVIKEKLGYRFDDGQIVVRDIIQTELDNVPQQVPNHPGTESRVPGCSPVCELALNLSTTVDQLTADVKKCKEVTEVLKDIVAKDETASRTLKFTGVLPPYDDAQYTAQFILQEKLGLTIPVVNATMEDDKSISFQVVSLDDKIHIIRTAKDKLEKMKSKIILKY